MIGKWIVLLCLLPLQLWAAEELKVLTYNIHHARGMDGKVDVDRIAKVIAAQKPDLVALQEVDRNCTRSGKQDIAAKLAETLGMEHCFGKTIDLQGGEYGLAILSRFPIAESKSHPLPKGGEPRIAFEAVNPPDGCIVISSSES